MDSKVGKNPKKYQKGRIYSLSIEEIQPDRVHVNTVVRPPAVGGVESVNLERLRQIAAELGPRAEVIAPPPTESQPTPPSDIAERILSMAARRPVTTACTGPRGSGAACPDPG